MLSLDLAKEVLAEYLNDYHEDIGNSQTVLTKDITGKDTETLQYDKTNYAVYQEGDSVRYDLTLDYLIHHGIHSPLVLDYLTDSCLHLDRLEKLCPECQPPTIRQLIKLYGRNLTLDTIQDNNLLNLEQTAKELLTSLSCPVPFDEYWYSKDSSCYFILNQDCAEDYNW